jgi:regulator of replication initiation timing
MNISVDDLLRKIGLLVVENDLLRSQNQSLQEQLTAAFAAADRDRPAEAAASKDVDGSAG